MRLVFLFLLNFSISFSQTSYKDFVVREANKYEGGTYVWKGSGCPIDLAYKDQVILPKSLVGTHCSGFTFTVVFNTLKENQLIDFLEMNQLKEFQNHWYGNTEVGAETQCVYALSKFKLGRNVSLEEAQAGDFVQFWRNNKSGHSVVFLAWVKDEKGKITGLKYRSSQKLTNGIGDRIEPIGFGEKDINPKRIYVGRIEK